MAKYTKGPWTVGDYSEHGQYVHHKDGIIVAEAYPDEHQDFEANARLIAAAPDLYKALRDIMRNYGQDCSETDPLFIAAHEALFKARGSDEA